MVTWLSSCVSLLLEAHKLYKIWVYPKDLNLVISAKTIFPSKVIFIGTEGQDFNISLGVHKSSHNNQFE